MGVVISWIQSNLADGENDERQGEARAENQPESLWGMINTLIPVMVISFVYLVIFIATRRSQKRFYTPRTYLGSLREHERSPELPDGLFSWLGTFWSIPDVYALKHQSLDAYLFLRYLRVCSVMCSVCMCVTWLVLIPVNATGGNGKAQLEMISYSNIDIANNASRLYAHAVVAWVVYGFVMYMITREYIFYINLRQAFLLTPQSSKRISSRTVLFTCVPDDYLDEAVVRKIFGDDAVNKVWVGGPVDQVEKVVRARDKVALQLELAETKLIRTVNKKHVEACRRSGGLDPPVLRDPESADVAARWVTDAERPAHRLGFLGLFGEKVDTIRWCRSQLRFLVPKAALAQSRWARGDHARVPAVFVEFKKQWDAEAAFQVVTHHHALSMAPKHIGVRPEEVLWSNLSIPWYQLIVREYIVYGLTAVLIIFWAIPVGVVGIVAQVSVIQGLPGLTWISQIPPVLLGVVSGLLPSAALALLMSVVPIIMRAFASFMGVVSLSQAELFTQDGFFLFQLVQVFLIRTITDTAATAIVQIVQSPTDVFGILAEALPTSSNFYISYFIIEGILIAIDVMTQVVGCVFFNLVYRLLSGNPRAMYKKWTTLSHISWGGVLPIYTGIAVISITYAIIAPILLFWAALGINIFYQAYRYDILFVSDTGVDTRGLIYPKALKQLFSGIYLAEVCLIGMFIVSKAIGQAALIIILLVFTILYHITLGRALDPLLSNLPRTLQAEEEYFRRQKSDLTDTTIMGPKDGQPRSKRGRVMSAMSGGSSIGITDRGNLLTRFLRPWVYADYWALRTLVPHEDQFNLPYASSGNGDGEAEANTYCPPAVTQRAPLLWIPRDPAGVSKQEIAETGKVIRISDEGCTVNSKNKLVWDIIGARPPIWEEKIYY